MRNPYTPPPAENTHLEWLRYIVQAAPPDAPYLKFMASLYSFYLDKGFLTDGQMFHAQRHINNARTWLEEQGIIPCGCVDSELAFYSNQALESWNPQPIAIPPGVTSLMEWKARRTKSRL